MIAAEELLTGVRWKVLKVLAEHGPLTASEIAERAQTTLPGVSQAMKLLEAYGYVAAKPQKRDGPGKPRKAYALKKGTAHIALCVDGFAERLTVIPSPMQTATLRSFILPAEERRWIQKLLWTYEHLLDAVNAIAYVRTEKDETHILVVTEDVENYRKEYSAITLESSKEKRKVVSWSHTSTELTAGIERQEQYFLNLLRNAVVIYDPEQLIARSNHA